MHHCLNLPHEGSTHRILAIGGQVNKKQGHPDPFILTEKMKESSVLKTGHTLLEKTWQMSRLSQYEILITLSTTTYEYEAIFSFREWDQNQSLETNMEFSNVDRINKRFMVDM